LWISDSGAEKGRSIPPEVGGVITGVWKMKNANTIAQGSNGFLIIKSVVNCVIRALLIPVFLFL